MAEEQQHASSLILSELPSELIQYVFACVDARAGVRLAACSSKLQQEAKRCQLLWDHVLAQGEQEVPYNYRVLAAAVKALTAEEAPALEAGSELLGRVGKAAVEAALFDARLQDDDEARWQAGMEAAKAFKEVPEAQFWLLCSLPARHAQVYMPGIKGVQVVVGVMHRSPQDADVQYFGCVCLSSLFFRPPARLVAHAWELGAVQAVVDALKRFAASDRNFLRFGIWALRNMQAGHGTNAAKLQAAGGMHYMHVELSDDDDDDDDDEHEEHEGA